MRISDSRFLNEQKSEKEKSVVFTFGRFQPPTAGHQLLINRVVREAKRLGAEHRIYPSASYDDKRNPIPHKDKYQIMKELFPDANIVYDTSAKTPFDVVAKLNKSKYTHVYMVVGGDRANEFRTNIGARVKSGDLNFKFNVIIAGKRDPDARGVVGISGSKMREFVANNDYASFLKGLPTGSPRSTAKKLFQTLRKTLKEDTHPTHMGFIVEIVSTMQDCLRGLMHRQSLAAGRGMLFDFKTESHTGIWMKNTHIPLDVVWINEEGIVVDVASLEPHDLNTTYSKHPARYVLEVNAGEFNGSIGDRLILEMDRISESSLPRTGTISIYTRELNERHTAYIMQRRN